jgi:hypothetical protein
VFNRASYCVYYYMWKPQIMLVQSALFLREKHQINRSKRCFKRFFVHEKHQNNRSKRCFKRVSVSSWAEMVRYFCYMFLGRNGVFYLLHVFLRVETMCFIWGLGPLGFKGLFFGILVETKHVFIQGFTQRGASNRFPCIPSHSCARLCTIPSSICYVTQFNQFNQTGALC